MGEKAQGLLPFFFRYHST